MTTALMAGVGLAIIAAIFNNVGMLLEKLSIRHMPPLHARRTREMLRTLFREPLWIAGFVLLVGGLGSQVFALTLAPISIVQAVSACGIVLLLYLSHRFLGDRLGWPEYAAMGLVLFALLLLGLSADAHSDQAHSAASFGSLAIAGVPAILLSFLCFLLAERVHGSSRGRARLRAPLYGLSSGLLYGVAALGVKAVSSIVESKGVFNSVGSILASPALYVVIVASATGFLFFQTALQRCMVSILIPVNNVTGSTYVIVVGTIVFHEHLPTAPFQLALRLAAFAAIITALVVLSSGRGVESALAVVPPHEGEDDAAPELSPAVDLIHQDERRQHSQDGPPVKVMRLSEAPLESG